MTQRPTGLPDYRNPPIDEVAIGVQFAPIKGFHDAYAGLYWEKVRDDYPRSETQPRIEGPIESDETPSTTAQFSIDPTAGGRTWLINRDDDLLIQIQNTRFIQNWRRRQAEYQHFEQLRSLFLRNYEKFRDLVNSDLSATLTIQQIEVTYINWIANMPMTEFLAPASMTKLPFLRSNAQPEEQSWSARYRLNNDLQAVSRLYAQCLPAIRPQTPGQNGSQFALVVRSARVDGIPEEDIIPLINEARLAIVRAFSELTTDTAQQAWGRLG